MKRCLVVAGALAALAVAPAAFAQVQGRQLFNNPQGSNQPAPGYQLPGFLRHGYNQTTDPGISLFNRPNTVPVGPPPTAGGANNFLTAIPGSVFRGTIFVPTPFSFK